MTLSPLVMFGLAVIGSLGVFAWVLNQRKHDRIRNRLGVFTPEPIAETRTSTGNRRRLLPGSTPEAWDWRDTYRPLQLYAKLASWAGLRRWWVPAALILIKIPMILLALALVGYYRDILDEHLNVDGLKVLLVILAFLIPDIWLYLYIRKRRELILRDLPFNLDMLVSLTEAGLSLDAGLQRIVQESHGARRPFVEEISVLNRELRLGMDRGYAFRRLGERINLDEVNSLIAAVVQSEAMGSPITQTLRAQSDMARARRWERAQQRAQKLPVKLVFPLFFCIFPSVFIVTFLPPFLQILEMISNNPLVNQMSR